jgi:hypothetical protein
MLGRCSSSCSWKRLEVASLAFAFGMLDIVIVGLE